MKLDLIINKLIEYLSRDKIVKLITFVTEMPEENDDNNRTYKFPFVSSEILSSEAYPILDMFFRPEVNKNYIPEDNDKPLLLTLKFKKEFITARRENKRHEDSGTAAQTINSEKEDALQNPSNERNSAEETKQGNIAHLGCNNAEVHSQDTPKVVQQLKIKANLRSSGATSDNSKTGSSDEIDLVSDKNKPQDDIPGEDPSDNDIKNKTSNQSDNTSNEENVHQNQEPEEQDQPEEVVYSEKQTGSDMSPTDEVNILLENKNSPEIKTQTARKRNPNYKYELLDMLFDFILQKQKGEEVNPVLSGYFNKIVLALLNYKQKEVMNYIYTREKLMDKLLDHVYDRSICDVIIKVLNISNNATTTNNTSVNNDSGEIFGNSKPNTSQQEESINYSVNYEAMRNEIIHKLIDKLIRAKAIEEYWNSSAILCEMAKFGPLFEFLSSPEIMDKISIGLENADEEGIKYTLRLYNVILREYSRDGTNKRINISALQDEEEEDNDAENDTLGLKFDSQAEDPHKDRNTSTDKSGDQSGSNLSKSAFVKENEKEKQFMMNVSAVIPLVVQLIKDDTNQKYIDTSYKENVKTFGSMKLEAVEMIKVITSKFCPIVKDKLIKTGVYETLFSLFEKYPNNSMLHSKIEEIIKFSLKTGGEEIVEEIMYKAQLIKYILELSIPEKRDLIFNATSNTITQGFFAFVINISNELISLSKENQEISNTLESIPEWGRFQEGKLKERNDLLVGPLGGRDPRTKIDSLFDDKDFLGRFKGFKPVPFDSIRNRRKHMSKQEDEVEQETEEEEEEEDTDQYFEDNEMVDLDLKDEDKPDFSKTSKDTLGDILAKSKCRAGKADRYATIDMDDDDMDEDNYEEDDEDDAQNKGLEWKIPPVIKETDDERLVDENIADVAMEFIVGQKQRRKHKKNMG